MILDLYMTKSELNRLSKYLTSKLTITGLLTSNCDVINPVIKVDYNTNYYNMNYVYIPDFKRYYYITDIEVVNDTMLLKLHVDVLMSFRNDIKTSTAFITRSNLGSKYIKDNLATKLEDTKVIYRNLGTGLTAGVSYIMIKGK